MLAYVFWHRPRKDVTREAYEDAQTRFHRSLARTPPAGMLGSAVFRLARLPFAPDGGYEDWYLISDHAALGVLRHAAVGRGHRSAHDRAAKLSGWGSAGLYAHVEGEPLAALHAPESVWIATAPGVRRPALAEMIGDGIDPGRASLWRRELVLGPAPELCVLAPEAPAGARPGRLPAGWLETSVARERLAGP